MLRIVPKGLYVVLAAVSYPGLYLLNKMLSSAEGTVRLAAEAAFWGQYILPALLLICALFLGRGDQRRPSAGGGRRRAAAHSVANSNHHSLVKGNPFRKMSVEEFERLLVSFFTGNGFTVEPPPPGLGDGVDLMLSKDDKTFVAQYRHWRELRVGVPMVREQYTVMQAARADGVYVITTGEFSYKAILFAEDKNISLIDGIKLRRLVNRSGGDSESSEAEKQAPTCPLCAAEMRVRTVIDPDGSNARFWRCSNYPKCSGALDRVGA